MTIELKTIVRRVVWCVTAAASIAGGVPLFAQREADGGTLGDQDVEIDELSPVVRRLTIGRNSGEVELVEGSSTVAAGKEVVWELRHDESKSVLPNKPSAGDEWDGARVVLSRRAEDLLGVLFEFEWDKTDPGTRRAFLNATWFGSKSQLEAWSGEILLFRVFRRNEKGKWGIELTAFPATFWKSLRDETPVEIAFRGEGEYLIRYAGTWTTQPKRRRSADGTTDFKLVYDPSSELLLSELESGERVCVFDSLWWLAEDALPIGIHDSGKVRLTSVYIHQAAAQRAGIRLASSGNL